jgi:hypothetical protein
MVACWSGLPTQSSAETTGVLRKSGPKSGRPWAMRRSWMPLQLLRLSMRSTGSPIRREYRLKTQTQNQPPNCAMRWGSMRLRRNEVKSPILETVATRRGAFDRRGNIRALAGPSAVRVMLGWRIGHSCPSEVGWPSDQAARVHCDTCGRGCVATRGARNKRERRRIGVIMLLAEDDSEQKVRFGAFLLGLQQPGWG